MARWNIGEIQVDRLVEFEGAAFRPEDMFTDFDPDVYERHGETLIPNYFNAAAGRVAGGVQSYVIRTAQHNIIVDTACGNGKSRNEPPFNNLKTNYLDQLAALGLQPEDIDHVVLTHLHVDHVGWNTIWRDGAWVPTFPNAIYAFTETDLDFVRQAAEAGPPGNTPARIYEDSLKPILDSGQARLIGDAGEYLPGVYIEFTPGHTPGQIMLRLISGAAQGFCIGDVMHNPLQIYLPHCNSHYCADPAQAQATRLRVLADAAQTKALLFACHFAGGHDVRVARSGDGYTLV